MYESDKSKDSLFFDENNLRIVGLDINTKDNIFVLSDGKKFKQNEKFIEKCNKTNDFLIKKIKSLGKLDNDAKSRLKKLKSKSSIYLKENVILLIHYCLENEYNHIVCEDLEIKYNDLDNNEYDPYNRLAYFMDLNSIKDIIKHYANKNGIMVSFVNPQFTSQQCPHCGYISKTNKKINKYFECESCHEFIGDADIVAAINIRNRVAVKELRNELMYYDNHFNGFRENVLIPKTTYMKLVKKPYLNGTPLEVSSVVKN